MKSALRFILPAATLIVVLSSTEQPANAATINVACNTGDLIAAVNTANNETTNPGPDTLELATACSYAFSSGTLGSVGISALPAITSTITINGNGATISRIAGSPSFNFLDVGSAGSLNVVNTTISGGHTPTFSPVFGAPGVPGGAANVQGTLTLTNSTMSGNSAGPGGTGQTGGAGQGGHGGAIIVSSGTLNVVNSTLSGNAAGNAGNRSCICIGGAGGNGGAIYGNGGTVNVVGSTISGNTAGNGSTGNDFGGIGGSGGAIYMLNGILNVSNSTISGNAGGNGGPSATPGAGGSGGLHVSIHGGTITNATIAVNSGGSGSTTGTGGVVFPNDNLFPKVIKNTLVANNSGGNCNGLPNATSATNVASDSTCGVGFVNNPAVALGALADNGGPTLTHAINSGGAAIDAGDSAVCAAAPVNNLDQRGIVRPLDGDGSGVATCDIGAFEAPPPQADPNFVVNTTAEDDDGVCHPLPLDCSLREAINAANANPSTSTITLGSGETYTLTSALPQISFSLVVIGNGSTIYRDFPAPHFRVITSAASALTLNNLTIRGGRAPNGPGAGQPGGSGGGISVSGSLFLNNSTVIANEAGTGGNTGILGGNGGQGGNGGGIYVVGAATITNSTIMNNTAGHGGTARMDAHATGHIGGDGGHGGGIYVAGGPLNVTNSTIGGNSAGNGGAGYNPGGDGGNGGGIYTNGVASSNLTNVTMSSNGAGGAQNGASGSGGSAYLAAGSVIAAKNTIIANSGIGGNCAGVAFGGASSTNLSSDASCGASFAVSGGLNLGPLQDNGGPTFTMAPGMPSAARDAGDNAVCAAAPVNNLDQRGLARPIDGDNNGSAICDIGAYEAPPSQAGPQFTVNSTAPDNDGLCQLPPGDCTLREAITAANADGVASTVVLGNLQTYTLNVIDNSSNGLPQVTTDITIQGNGSTIARGGGAPQFRIFLVSGGGTLTIQDATVSGGYAPDADAQGGGGILLAPGGATNLSRTAVSGNRSGNGTGGAPQGKPGGGIHAMSATLTLTESTISSNVAGDGMAGSAGAGGHGGGIYSSGSGALTINGSTIAGNAGGNGADLGGFGGSGGGIFIEPGINRTIANTTIANNAGGNGGGGAPGGSGGGIANFSAALVLTNATISANAVGSGGSPGNGGNVYNGASATIKNSIISGPTTDANCFGAPFNPTSASNLASDASCVNGVTQQTTGQINLGPLANHGGHTQTMALMLPSSAIDFGDTAACAAAPVSNLDQRGLARPYDGDANGSINCDVGAFEYCPDADADLRCTPFDNCPNWANAAQNLPIWPVPANDPDCDGWNNAREIHVGTDPTKHCNDNTGVNNEPDAWPGDFNDDRITNLPDVISFGPTFNKLPNDDGYNQRYDLNMTNQVLLSDVVTLGPFFNRMCS